jgi:hypothetical protein
MKIKFGFMHGYYISKNNKYYVYVYSDPDTNIPFYVGKGSGKRSEFHLKDFSGKNPHKENKIRKLLSEGKLPKIDIIYSGLPESIAYSFETLKIEQLGTIKDRTGPLTNILKSDWHRTYDPKYANYTAYEKVSEKQKKNWADPNSSYNSPEYRKKIGKLRTGAGNPRYGDHRTYEEIHGKDRANNLKKDQSERQSGCGNNIAKKWVLVSPEQVVIRSHGNLEEICNNHSLSMHSLKKSLNKTFIPEKSVAKRKNMATSAGWALYTEEYYKENFNE